MLIGVIQETGIEALVHTLARVPEHFDMIELRLDALETVDITALRSIALPKPAIFTLRPKDQGGAFGGPEALRLELLEQLAALCPACIDVEYTTSPEWVERIRQASPASQLILSYHNFSHTPADLEAIRQNMLHTAPGAVCKIATMANSTLDALRMLVFCKQSPAPVIGICMGEKGSSTRILAPVVHTGFAYCPVTTASAPGQIEAATLCDLYNFKQLGPTSALYGLIGDPVDKSIGHLHHNARNKQYGDKAVYVKWQLVPEELPAAMPLFRALDVRGLSVTMPLKEPVLPLMDTVDTEAAAIGAVNTLVFKNGLVSGYNTDAAGAIRALPGTLKGKKVAVLGAGGAAKAIVHELRKEQAQVLVLNRSPEKAVALGVPVLPLARLASLALEACDYTINTLPISAELPLTDNSFTQGSVAMDITYMGHSIFLSAAKKAGCECIEGTAMYQCQADMQRTLWGLGAPASA